MDSVQEKISSINASVDTVTRAVQHVNDTAADMLDQVSDALGGSLVLLEGITASTAAIAAFSGGDKTTAAVSDFLASVSPKLEQVQADVKTFVDALGPTLMEVLLGFSDAKDTVWGSFATAVEKVTALCAPKAEVALLARGSSVGPFDWLKKVFGGGASSGDSEYKQAIDAINSANDTVSQVDKLLDDFNNTAASQLADLVILVNSSLSDFADFLPGAFDAVRDVLPKSVMKIVEAGTYNSLNEAMAVMTQLTSIVSTSLDEVNDLIVEARTQLAPLYSASDDLVDMAESAQAANAEAPDKSRTST